MFFWKMNKTINHDPKIDNDFQIAIDQDDVEMFIKLLSELENNSTLSIECSRLAEGQPHGTDDNVQYGKPSEIFSELILSRNDKRTKIIMPEYLNKGVVKFELSKCTINSICRMAKLACNSDAAYGNVHYLEIFDSRAKLNFWGWCYNGVIAYAH